uniref:Uncharacterized protein n=1 Tax=Schizaphis graminum TaxID=13262 RepID=A0A2S2NCR7_SCHGA
MSSKKITFLKVNVRMVTCVFRVSIRPNNSLGVTRAGRGARAYANIDCYLLIIVKSPCKTTQYNNNASTTGPSPVRTNIMYRCTAYTGLSGVTKDGKTSRATR